MSSISKQVDFGKPFYGWVQSVGVANGEIRILFEMDSEVWPPDAQTASWDGRRVEVRFEVVE